MLLNSKNKVYSEFLKKADRAELILKIEIILNILKKDAILNILKKDIILNYSKKGCYFEFIILLRLIANTRANRNVLR